MRIALATVAVLFVLPAAAGAGRGPAVAALDLDPVTIKGVRFHAGERVRVHVVVTGAGARTRVVRAGPRGGFVVRFRSLRLTDCEGYRIRATGSRGSRATRNEPPAPCVPIAP